MAITVSGVENFYANRFDVALKDDRIMTATADGYHLQACLGEVKITNSIIENTHDDALNIKSGYYYSLNTVDPVARTLTISKKTGAIALPKAGETLKVYAQTDFAERGSFTVGGGGRQLCGYGQGTYKRRCGLDKVCRYECFRSAPLYLFR